ncbi:MAG: tetratricopeptide repeat protein [Verrucomicrobiia bacterium]|jgi:tetratricopeptide (TPR) repeat protein
MRQLVFRILPLATLFLTVMTGSGCTQAARRARHLARANQYFDSGELDKAEIEYLIVLKTDLTNAQAIGRLGMIYYEQGRYGRAVPFLIKGKELAPEDLDLRRKLAAIYLSAGKMKAARDEAGFVLDRKPQDDEAPLLLAQAAVTTNAVAEARERLKAAVQKAGETAALDVGLAHLEQTRGDFQGAAADLQRAKALDPKSSSVFWAYGNLYFAQNDWKQAEEAFKTSAELSPPRSPRRLGYAQYKIRAGDLAVGKQLLQEITRKTPDYLPAWRWLAEIALAETNYDESADLVGKMLARDSLNYDALLLNGRLYLARAEVDKAIGEFKKALAAYPQSPEIHYQLAVSYLAKNEVGQAVTSLNQTLSLAPNFAEATVLLAGIEMRTGEVGAAIASLKPLVEKRPQFVQAQFLLADGYRARGDFESAIEIYRAMEELAPKNPDAPFLMGMTFLQEKKRDEARAAFGRAVELSPDYVAGVEQLVDMDIADKQYGTALQQVQPLLDRNPKSAEARLVQAKIFLAQQDVKRAEAALLKAVELKPESRTAHLVLARLYVDTQQEQKALDDLRAFVEKNPKDAAAWMFIGMIQEQQKDDNAARDTYEKLLAANPQYTPAMNNLAWLYAEHFGQTDKAYGIASKARELQPHDPFAADTLGWILYRMKQYPKALTLLQESAGKLGKQPDVQLHLGLTYYMLGEEGPARAALQHARELNKDVTGHEEADRCLAILAIDPASAGPEARAMLDKRLAATADDPVARARLAAIDERAGNFDKATEAYQLILTANPNDVGALVNLARLYSARLNDPHKAIEFAKSAYKVAPDDPSVSAILGRLAFQTGDYKWAASLLQQASRQQPLNPEVLFDFALASYSVGQVSDAVSSAKSALQAGTGFSRADATARFLDMIALADDPKQAAASSSRVQDILKSQPDYVPALMVLGAMEDQKPDLRAAEQIYEKVLSLYPDFGPAKRRLAILYAADQPADNQKALQLAMQAREAFPDDPDVAKALGILAYRQGDYVRSSTLLQESTSKRTADAQVFYYLGMAQYRLREPSESKQSLQRALDLNLEAGLAVEAKRTLAELK